MAQSDHPKAFAGIAVGAAFPQSSFAGTEFEKNDQGYAQNGNYLEVNAGYRFMNNLGGVIMFRGQRHEYDVQTQANQLASEYPGNTIKVESEQWTRTGVMIGLNGILPLGPEKRTALELKGMIGSMKAVIPEQTLRASNANEWEEINFAEADNSAFAYLAGIALRYNISPRFALSVTGDYLSSEHTFDVTVSSRYSGPAGSSEALTENAAFTQKIETINVGLGLAYRFF